MHRNCGELLLRSGLQHSLAAWHEIKRYQGIHTSPYLRAMNVLRLLGDLCHLTSILILIYKIHARKTTAGISLRTRVLYLLVFLSRYGDIFLYYISFYNTFMKILYLSTTSYIIYLMTISPEFKNTWYHDLDNFAILPLVIGCFTLMLICTAKYTIFEMSWTFSIILESVAILPQIDHLTKVPTLPALPLSHLVALGIYRAFYVLNWGVRLITDGYWDFTAFFYGLVQTVIWADFLWVWYNRKQIKLPPNTSGQGLRSEEDGAGEGQEIDEGDMSRSLVITHVFRLTKAFQSRYMAGRQAPALSVSAYPDQVPVARSADVEGTYSDAPERQNVEDARAAEVAPDLAETSTHKNTVTMAENDVLAAESSEAWQNSGDTQTSRAQSKTLFNDGFSVGSDEGANARQV